MSTTLTRADLEKFVKTQVDQQMADLKAQYQSKIDNLTERLRQANIDLVSKQFEKDRKRDESAIGRGELRQFSGSLTKEEYAKMLPARLSEASFEEVILTEAALNGVDIRNSAELNAYLGAESKRAVKNE